MRASLHRAFIGSIALLPLLFISCVVVAQAITSTVVESPSTVELFDTGAKVYQDWRSAGALAGVVALVKFFVDITKLRVIDNWLWDHQWRWVRPLMALSLGGLASVLAAGAVLKMDIAIAFVHGVLAGAGSIGVNELVTMFGDRKAIKADEALAIAAYRSEKAEGKIA